MHNNTGHETAAMTDRHAPLNPDGVVAAMTRLAIIAGTQSGRSASRPGTQKNQKLKQSRYLW
ncbi:MAG: hypothetical protein ACQEUZ_13280 [Pseudomonadota bacterium]